MRKEINPGYKHTATVGSLSIALAQSLCVGYVNIQQPSLSGRDLRPIVMLEVGLVS